MIPGQPTPRIDAILAVVAARWGTSIANLKDASREHPIADARHVAMYLARDMTSMSMVAIGKKMGFRHHSTVCHAYQKVKENIRRHAEVKRLVAELETEVRAVGERRFQSLKGIPPEMGAQGRSAANAGKELVVGRPDSSSKEFRS